MLRMEKQGRKRNRGKSRVVLKKPTRHYVCIVCPRCCELETDGVSVVGGKCEKGEAFACQEWVEPLRVLTTTIHCETEKGFYILPVKTASSVPLSRVTTIMKGIKSVRLSEVPPIGARIAVPGLAEPLDVIVTGDGAT